MRHEISFSLHGSPWVQLATAHGQASGNGAFPHLCTQMCAGGEICWGGALQVTDTAQKGNVGAGWCVLGWFWGNTIIPVLLPTEAELAKWRPQRMQHVAFVNRLELPLFSYFPLCRKYPQSTHPWFPVAKKGGEHVQWQKEALPPARGSTQPPALPWENFLLITSLLPLSPH